jgi:hypothetical protein
MAPDVADALGGMQAARDIAASQGEGAAKKASGAGSASATAEHSQLAFRVAVYDFKLQGVSEEIGSVVTMSMLSEIRKLRRLSVIGMQEIRDMLSHEASKQMLGCENESCLAEIAGALGVDILVSGALSKLDDGHVFVARRIDQKRARVEGVVNKRLSGGTGEELLAAVGPTVEELFADFPMREGQERGVAPEVALRLNPPPLPKWSFWTVATAAAVTAGAGGMFAMLASTAAKDHNDYAQLGLTQQISGSTLRSKHDLAAHRQTTSTTFYMSSGALALVASVMALFTDWHGYSDAPK